MVIRQSLPTSYSFRSLKSICICGGGSGGGENRMLEKKDIRVDHYIHRFIGMRLSATVGGTVIAVDVGAACLN